jgi:hypothetical protein
MAQLIVGGDDLRIHLSFFGRIGAFVHGDGSVPLRAIRDVRATEDPWAELRGVRSPGINLRGVIALGTRRHSLGRDFVAVYGRGPAVVVDLAGVGYARLVISRHDAEYVADEIRSAAAEAHSFGPG